MFERFTDRARRVVVLAQDEARMLNHNYIGTEHILLGLIGENGGIASQVFASLGLDLDQARSDVLKLIGKGTQAPSGHIPFTPRGKKCLELALREALQLGHNYIGTEHVLLGMIREGEGVGAQVMVRNGLDLNKVRQAVIEALNRPVKVAKPKVAQEDKGRLFVRVRELQEREGVDVETSEIYEYDLNQVVTENVTVNTIELGFNDGTSVAHNLRYVEQWWSEASA
jgi:ATP-dependent Clp protease ATP-binding subunit ClpA